MGWRASRWTDVQLGQIHSRASCFLRIATRLPPSWKSHSDQLVASTEPYSNYK